MSAWFRGTTILWLAMLLSGSLRAQPISEVQRVPPDQAVSVLGQRVADAEGKEVGRLVDVLVGRNGEPEAAVIDFGGFLGVGSRKVAVHWGALHFAPADPKFQITLELTADQIKAVPEYKEPGTPASVVVPTPAPAQ